MHNLDIFVAKVCRKKKTLKCREKERYQNDEM